MPKNTTRHLPSFLVGITDAKRREAICAAISDINDLRMMVLQLENQILKNEALVECLLAMKPETDKLTDEIINHPPKVDNEQATPLTVPEMVRDVLPGIAQPFTYQCVIKSILAKHPSADERHIRQGVYPAIIQMKKKGAVVGDSNGAMILKA